MEFAPVALFAFNRPEHLRRTIEALKANKHASSTSLYIFADGSRSEKDLPQVNAVREIASAVTGFKEVIKVFRERNFGLADSISEGVTFLAEKFGKVIVLEDDIITSPGFLDYMNTALNLYEKNDQVMHIAGYMPEISPEGLPESFFLRQSSCWGWATWKRSWNKFHRNGKEFVDAFTDEEIRTFNLNGAYNYWNQLLLNEQGAIKTWAVYWYAVVFKNNGLCLHPRTSLVSNIGFDGSGENCGKLVVEMKLSKNPVNAFPGHHEIQVNETASNRFNEFFMRTGYVSWKKKLLKLPFTVLKKVTRLSEKVLRP